MKPTNSSQNVAVQVKTFPGYVYGLRQPCVAGRLRCGVPVDAKILQKVDAHLGNPLSRLNPAAGQDGMGRLAMTIAQWMQHFHRLAGLQVHDKGQVVTGGPNSGLAMVVVPSRAAGLHLAAETLQGLIQLINHVQEGRPPAAALQKLSDLVQQLRNTAASSANTPRFISAAHQLGMPCFELPGRIVQFGYGSCARWLDSSFTDATPHISARLARYKVLTATFLRQAGIPVPEHVQVETQEAALDAAARLGYPVVVKPADKDGGEGVAAGLASADEVREAFRAVQKLSGQVLVEKHFEGRDYRLTVLHGEVIWAIERVPGGVTGDGARTVRQLLEQHNADPRRGQGVHALLKQVTLDDEAHAMLGRAGLDEHSIPGAGEFVRLRRTANVATGGTPVAVLEQVHPDNRRLAIRAAAALQLDLAGVDLLIPDITRSWRECGAVICEVNSQPSIGQTTSAHLYGDILQQLVPGNGRIPITVVLGAGPDNTLNAELPSRLQDEGMTVGWLAAEGGTVGGEFVVEGSTAIFRGGRALMLDRRVKAAVICINHADALLKGLPFERFDLLVLAGTHVALPQDQSDQPRGAFIRELLNSLLPACDGNVMSVAGSALNVEGLERFTPARWIREPVQPERLAGCVAEEMLAAGARHKASPV